MIAGGEPFSFLKSLERHSSTALFFLGDCLLDFLLGTNLELLVERFY